MHSHRWVGNHAVELAVIGGGSQMVGPGDFLDVETSDTLNKEYMENGLLIPTTPVPAAAAANAKVDDSD